MPVDPGIGKRGVALNLFGQVALRWEPRGPGSDPCAHTGSIQVGERSPELKMADDQRRSVPVRCQQRSRQFAVKNPMKEIAVRESVNQCRIAGLYCSFQRLFEPAVG